MSLGLLYYLGVVIDGVKVIASVIGIFYFVITLTLFCCSRTECYTESEKKECNKYYKKHFIVCIILAMFGLFLPTKTDFFIIVSIDPIVNEVKESLDEGKLGKVSDLIDKSLDNICPNCHNEFHNFDKKYEILLPESFFEEIRAEYKKGRGKYNERNL